MNWCFRLQHTLLRQKVTGVNEAKFCRYGSQKDEGPFFLSLLSLIILTYLLDVCSPDILTDCSVHTDSLSATKMKGIKATQLWGK